MENSSETLERSEKPRTYDVYFKKSNALANKLTSDVRWIKAGRLRTTLWAASRSAPGGHARGRSAVAERPNPQMHTMKRLPWGT